MIDLKVGDRIGFSGFGNLKVGEIISIIGDTIVAVKYYTLQSSEVVEKLDQNDPDR